MSLLGQMEAARRGIIDDQIAWDKQKKDYEAESRRRAVKREEILGYLRRANISDYLDWLLAYSKINKTVFTHRYDYTFYNGEFYVALDDFTISPLYGAGSINIIVPKQVHINGELGHINLYLHGDKPEAIGGWVPY